MADLVNSVGGTYPEPANMWSPAGYDTQSDPSQVLLDRRTRDLPINFDTVPSKRQANQLASLYYNENRYEATAAVRSEEHTSELQSLMRISYAVFCLKKTNQQSYTTTHHHTQPQYHTST